MNPITRAITGDRGFPPAEKILHWQGAPLRLAVRLRDETIDGAAELIAEIHASQISTAGPLAGVSLATPTGSGPWDLDFTGGDMAQSIVSGHTTRTLWLAVIASFTDYIEVLAVREIVLQRSNYSGIDVSDPGEGTIIVYDSVIALTSGADTIYLPRLASVTSPGSIQAGPDIISAITIEITHALLTIADSIIAVPAVTDPGDPGSPIAASAAITSVIAYAGHIEITTASGTTLVPRIDIPS